MRVVVNGERVLERVLVPGTREFRWVVALPESALHGQELNVGIQLHGDLPDALCHNDRSIGAVVTLDARSGIEMDLRSAVSSLRDAVSLLPSEVTIAVPATGDADFVPLAMRLGARMTQRGYQVKFMDLEELGRYRLATRGLILLGSEAQLAAGGFERFGNDQHGGAATLWRQGDFVHLGLTEADRMDVADFITSDMLPLARTAFVSPSQFVESHDEALMTRFGDIGVDTSIQRIAEARSWDIGYGLAALPDGRVPDRLRLAIRLPEGPGDFTNLVHTELNGVLIDSRHMETGRLNMFTLNLPHEVQNLRNDLRVSVQRHREAGGCTITARRYPVQLLPESGFLYDEVSEPLAGLAGLPHLFRDRVALRFPSGLEGRERLDALELGSEVVASFVPLTAVIDFDYVDTAAGRANDAIEPFIAINHAPSNVILPIGIEGDRLAMRDTRRVNSADIRSVSNVGILQAVTASLARPGPGQPDRIVDIPGLVAHALGTPPSLMTSPIGQEQVSVVHDEGAVLTLE
ncbi:hypothetical protein [uncultured Maricaulis sp.]|jgi:hypothetical protein|uniref:hypothetical protein n=1 Tax=uncultured Maricaulis sp. TaxID=174710 RepID=UPI0025E3D1E8|nr:hypothetical protein [uncultured Maricaulis sp.]